MKEAEIDGALVTGDIPPPASASERIRSSDELTIRNAVSAADLEAIGSEPVLWANPDTGARGAITGILETREGSRLCRGFVTTRENFDGVRLFRGEACMIGAGVWRMQDFRAS